MNGSELVRQLRELAELHTSGAITTDEFSLAKAQLLRGTAPYSSDAGSHGSSAEHLDPMAPDPGAPDPAQLSSRPPQHPGSYQPLVTATPAPPVTANVGSNPGKPVAQSASPVWAGAITALVGGLVTLLAFLAMPVVTLPFVGSITGAGLAGLASQQGAGSFALLWLVPLAAAGVAGIGAWQLFAPSIPFGASRRASMVVLALAGATVLAYIAALAVVQSEISRSGASQAGISAGGLVGAGFWIALLGMLAAGIAASVDLMGLRPAAMLPGYRPRQ